MTTIVEPKDFILKLWGKQPINSGATYRMMRYVFRVNHDGKILLHNVVTGQLIVLEQEEADLLERLPLKYNSVMMNLIAYHYLVPNNFDEYQEVLGLRNVLHRLDQSYPKPKYISHYTILPTTACNARCYYCFEHGVTPFTMTDKIAEDTINFISEHYNPNRNVSIRWFGGEPTVAANRINQICAGLQKKGIQYVSSMTTNGYLFDEHMVSNARKRWHLRQVMISVDGVGQNYNSIKSYVSAKDNPYERVLRNIGLLLENKIQVELRMNFDLSNYHDFYVLLDEVRKRFQGNRKFKYLQVHAFPVLGEHPDSTGRINHGDDKWFNTMVTELNDTARDAGLFRSLKELPYLYFAVCSAGNPSYIVITPQGKLARCSRIFDEEDQIIGSVADGINKSDYTISWSKLTEPVRCKECSLLPSCILIERCPSKGKCFVNEKRKQNEEIIKNVYNSCFSTIN